MSMDRFMIRARANDGRKIFLADPATGQLTDEWLLIRNRWCDEFQEAKSAAMQQALAAARGEAAADAKDRGLDLVASLVAGWSFEPACSREAVTAFLREAPQIVDQIDRLATQDAFFFRSDPSDS